ncbi:MAG: dihydrodipicolinate synthetase [Paenibacillaceae bacterium]|jgi:4-hydroxy-tetrahydrodipicolinate synthase|nr:dihydrodipicolinate synthetase [Paenibacillaceae bacterium]
MNHPYFLPYSVAMITPFTREDAVDEAGIRRMVEYYKEHQVPALLVSGSTGEQHSLKVDERISLYRMVKKAAGELPLYAGVAAIRTRDAVRLAKEAEQEGYAAIMLGFPPYVRPNQQEVAQYVQAVCAVTSLPVMLYNNPLRTGFNLEPETLIRLVEQHPQITALKEAGSPDHVKLTQERLTPGFQVLSGSDLTIAEYFDKGYNGLTSVAGNLFPREMGRIIGLLREGRQGEARELLAVLEPRLTLASRIGWVRVIRHRFAALGLISASCREPLTSLTEEEQAELAGAGMWG